ncbi:MAG: alpha-amylase [Paludibacter sp.]|nr:alpha-amylase [Paludibacter sp.]
MKKRSFILFLIAIALTACKPKLDFPTDSENNLNLNTLITLKIGGNKVYLQDFVMNPLDIDSITSTSEQLICMVDSNKLTANFTANKEMEHFVDVKLWIKGIPYSIPCRKTDKIDYVFTFNPQAKVYKKVQIAGQMNDWAPIFTPDLKLNNDRLFEVTLNVSPGTYLYQMVLDGNQNHDDNNPNKVDNGYGKFNSILQVAGQNDKFPTLLTDKYTSSTITLSVYNDVTNVFVYWQNFVLPSQFIKTENGFITFEIPAEAKKMERSFFRVWACNEFGVSNDVLIPLEKGKVLTKSKHITRNDRQAQIIYFMLVDRFKNGDTSNDHPLNRPDVNQKVDYWGGDLAGLQQKIEDGYFDKLGANTLWISPMSQNPMEPYGYYAPMKTKFSGYHGYWPISSSKVDYRFGTNDDLKSVVKSAHKNEMNVLLDYVANHVHEKHPLYQQHPEYATSLYLPDGTMNVEKWNEHRLTTWFDTFLPSLDFSNPKVVDMMTDSAMFWIKEFQLDGFRHDACKHINEEFWRELTLKIKKNNHGKNLYQIGETYGSPELISSYLTSGMLDGQFDFNVFDEASTAFSGVGAGDLQRVKNVMQTSLNTYGYHNLMGYISGNHDRARFMSYASRDVKFGEDAKAAGWQREIGITDSTAYDKMFLLNAFNMTIPGIPVIYYGDEIGMPGANDPDCRRMMRFDGWNKRETSLWNKVSKLAHLRSENPVLIYGDFINLHTTMDSWVYARNYFDKKAIVFINNSSIPKKLEVELPEILNPEGLKSIFNNNFVVKKNKISIELPAFSAEILL